MRLSTVFVSSAFILAGVSTALPLANLALEARFADSDLLSGVEARAFDDEHEFYARGHNGPRSSPTHNHKLVLPSQVEDFDRRSYYVLYDDELVARGSFISTEVAPTQSSKLANTQAPRPRTPSPISILKTTSRQQYDTKSPEQHVTFAENTKTSPPERPKSPKRPPSPYPQANPSKRQRS